MTVRASLDAGSYDGDTEVQVTTNDGMGSGMKSGYQAAPMGGMGEPARVILGLLADQGQLEVFRAAFASLGMVVELVPATGADNILNVSPAAGCWLLAAIGVGRQALGDSRWAIGGRPHRAGMLRCAC